jgi:hypothetical protein
MRLARFASSAWLGSPTRSTCRTFQKKTERTSKADVELAAKRYRELLKDLGQ